LGTPARTAHRSAAPAALAGGDCARLRHIQRRALRQRIAPPSSGSDGGGGTHALKPTRRRCCARRITLPSAARFLAGHRRPHAPAALRRITSLMAKHAIVRWRGTNAFGARWRDLGGGGNFVALAWPAGVAFGGIVTRRTSNASPSRFVDR